LTEQTKNAWIQPLTTDAIRTRYLGALIQAGYVDSQDHPIDKRAKHFRPLIDKNTRQNTILHDTEMFSLDSLREALESLRIIQDRKHDISIQDFNGQPLTIEQLHEKYYSALPGAPSVILLGEETAQNGETGENIAMSGKNGYNRVNKEANATGDAGDAPPNPNDKRRQRIYPLNGGGEKNKEVKLTQFEKDQLILGIVTTNPDIKTDGIRTQVFKDHKIGVNEVNDTLNLLIRDGAVFNPHPGVWRRV
jgi:hypothetical protein